jgi:hypothetical protein
MNPVAPYAGQDQQQVINRPVRIARIAEEQVRAARSVGPYTGQAQQQVIDIPASSRYRQEREESCWSLPPYARIFPPPTQAPGVAFVPPPIYTSDLWSAQQVWPL